MAADLARRSPGREGDEVTPDKDGYDAPMFTEMKPEIEQSSDGILLHPVPLVSENIE